MEKENYQAYTDQELLDRYYASADNQWLGHLLDRYTLLLLGLCMKYLKQEEEARDMVQQVFLKVLTELPKYKVVYFKSWLYMVAKNSCLMKIRGQRGKLPLELNESTTIANVTTDIDETIIEKETLLHWMEECLTQLNDEQQQCLTRFYLEKKSYQEIVESTGFSMMQVKSHIQNGKRNLKILLEKRKTAS